MPRLPVTARACPTVRTRVVDFQVALRRRAGAAGGSAAGAALELDEDELELELDDLRVGGGGPPCVLAGDFGGTDVRRLGASSSVRSESLSRIGDGGAGTFLILRSGARRVEANTRLFGEGALLLGEGAAFFGDARLGLTPPVPSSSESLSVSPDVGKRAGAAEGGCARRW